jgi:TRAP-type mannitol/chloroaromatic compound transport system permease large subunit
MANIYKAALPFLGIQLIGLTLCMVFPELITWLPAQVYGGR